MKITLAKAVALINKSLKERNVKQFAGEVESFIESQIVLKEGKIVELKKDLEQDGASRNEDFLTQLALSVGDVKALSARKDRKAAAKSYVKNALGNMSTLVSEEEAIKSDIETKKAEVAELKALLEFLEGLADALAETVEVEVENAK